jgi:transcriptional regulator with XRE-family HTH domain
LDEGRRRRDRACHTSAARSPRREDEVGLHQTFAAALRSAREASGWSQADLAHRVGLSVEAYGRLERGRVLPRASTLVRLARSLNVGLDDLLGLHDSSEHAAEGDDLRLRAVFGRLREVPPEDLRFLVSVLDELQRWRSEIRARRT